jgi:hypothetical protein
MRDGRATRTAPPAQPQFFEFKAFFAVRMVPFELKGF